MLFRSPGIDSLRVSITAYHGIGGGLAELQLLDDRGKNVAPEFDISVSSSYKNRDLAPQLLDGDFAAGGESEWALPDKQLGWVEIRRRDALGRK